MLPLLPVVGQSTKSVGWKATLTLCSLPSLQPVVAAVREGAAATGKLSFLLCSVQTLPDYSVRVYSSV